jgi:hypothetical protein
MLYDVYGTAQIDIATKSIQADSHREAIIVCSNEFSEYDICVRLIHKKTSQTIDINNVSINWVRAFEEDES